MISPVEEVEYVTDDHEAARLRLDFTAALRRPALPEDQVADYRAALAELDRRWPRAHVESMIATEAELYGEAGAPREHRKHRQQLRREAGINATEAARQRRARRGDHQPRRPGQPRRPAGGRRERAREVGAELGGAGRRAAELSGATQLAGGIGDTVLAFIRLGLGLALVYFLLGDRGSKGLAGVLTMVSNGVRVFIAPVDPLSRTRPTAKTVLGYQSYEAAVAAGAVAGPARPGDVRAMPIDQATAALAGGPLIGGFPHPTVNTP